MDQRDGRRSPLLWLMAQRVVVVQAVIVARLNLVCRHGHRHFVPERDLAEWIGKDCLQGTRTKEGLLAVRGRCLETLRPMTVPEAWKFPKS